MKPTPAIAPLDPCHAEIQHAAYQLWLDSGRPEAHDFELWLAAKEMLLHRHSPHANSSRGVPERLVTENADPSSNAILEVTIQNRRQAVSSSVRGAKILP